MERRDLMREAACVAGAWAAVGAWPVVAQAQERRPYARSRLVDHLGEPMKAASLRVGEAMVFSYPYLATPAFLMALSQPAKTAALTTQARQPYEAPSGVGPRRAIVAFSAICAHKLVYPTPQHSFIGLRKGGSGEPAQLIHCCSDNSRYDPLQGARVIGGPAPQPLAAVLLEWDAASDELHAVGTQGGELFGSFFDKYAVRLEMELGTRARALAGATTLTQAASAFSRQWQSCSV
jgi:arsenite oxidase small subunit